MSTMDALPEHGNDSRPHVAQSDVDSSTIIATAQGSEASIKADDWTFAAQLREDQRARQERGLPAKRHLSLSWQSLSVRGVGGVDDVVFAPDLGSLFMPWTVAAQKKRQQQYSEALRAKQADDGVNDMTWNPSMPKLKKGQEGLRKGERYLLKDFYGLLKPGEMMLVVGRPGSGCTTFLKALAGQTGSYAGVDGAVYYGALKAGSKAMRPLAADVSFNSEEDLHDPNLQVGRTMDFALRTQTPSDAARPLGPDGKVMSAKDWQAKTKSDLLRAFGIAHTDTTKVGDQYIRGVSGGERKRVSLAEVLTTGAQIQCWDNATRGLDASTALGFAKVCRTLCDVDNRINVVSLYQAGNGIYEQFDKVTVIAEGRLLYYGPRAEARPYFEKLGFVHMDGANTADYLTAVTALDERQVVEGMDDEVPNTAAEFAEIYQNSELAARMRAEVDAWIADKPAREAETAESREYAHQVKSKYAFKGLAQRASFFTQLRAAIIKDAQQRWGDQWSLWARQGTTVIQALINGSVFYKIPLTTNGLFLRGGVLFMTVLFPIILAFADVASAFVGRNVLAKHKGYSMYRPAVLLLAQSIVDLPIYFVQLIVYTLITYFMAGLQKEAGLYFICFLFTWLVALTMTTLFRTVGYSFNIYNDASKVSGTIFTLFVYYGGFVIYTPSMHPWFSWLRWLNPVYYSLEALMADEMDGLNIQCAPPQLAPYGPGYEGMPAGCAIPGAEPGSTVLSGTAWMHVALRFYKEHVWRNFGIIIALWVGFMALGMWSLERIPAAGSTAGVTLYKRGGGGAFMPRDEEEAQETKLAIATADKPRYEPGGPDADRSGAANAIEKMTSRASRNSEARLQRQRTRNDLEQRISRQISRGVHGTTFTWKDLSYTVRADGADKQLLDKVSGFCKAGTITALMGSSGAGKTTLMDVLAARKSEGEIHGEVLLNGRPLPISFQRTTGYCEQLDVHLPQATVREALEFSALLRQPRSTPKEEKLEYVDTIIDLLELRDIEDAIIGIPGAGLGVEQRKRLTIGVELVSRPSLLFLDEPTSGLDGQSSFMIVSFLRKLAATGQSILCTIHQPSAALFAGFDQLLLLKAGGKTVYFGSIEDMPTYFSKQGIDWPAAENPAEYMIDVVSGDKSRGRDWAEVWLESEERKHMMVELEDVKSASLGQATHTDEDNHEFAATTMTQLKLVTQRSTVQLYRDVEYVMNKCMLHISVGLITGFSWWKIGNSYADLQNRMFTIFNFVFVAPGVIVQTQPKFIANRDIFEAREKKAKFYSWQVFCAGEIVAEFPYLLICAFLFWVTWYPTAGLDMSPGAAGPVYLQMTLYELLYTGMGQFIAAYAPNPVFAAMVLPLFISVLVTFAGVMIPYQALTSFWKYWMFWLDPFTYLMQGLLTFPIWNVDVKCKDNEYGLFDPPAGQTCGQYLEAFMQHATGYINNPEATSGCQYCGYKKGYEFLNNINIKRHFDGWRGILITLLFVITSYAFVFLLLKLRTKKSKTAS